MQVDHCCGALEPRLRLTGLKPALRQAIRVEIHGQVDAG
jgi:hypothetical protein